MLVITGPTASGKTELALRLADRVPVHLISADSAMVYRGMDIGTAKPDAETLSQYPHALVDVRDPAEAYTVADFVHDADVEVQRALEQGRLPVLVGGTMMYLKAFRDGLDELPRSTPEVRAAVQARAAREGWDALHHVLVQVDPRAAAQIHANNPQRLARALEVYELTGQPISSFWGRAASAEQRLRASLVEVSVDVDERRTLHARIEQRLAQMLKGGLVEEVARLRSRSDLHADLPSMRAVGYRQVWSHLDGATDHATMAQEVLVATRTLARRQYTWLRRWTHLKRVENTDLAGAADDLARLAFA